MAAGERSILLRDQLDVRAFLDLRTGGWEAALTGTLEAYLHETKSQRRTVAGAPLALNLY